MKVAFTQRANLDLADIGNWIARDNPRAAARMVDRLINAGDGLADISLRYPATHRSLRKRPVGAYVIFYRITDRVEIVRVLHSARDWLSLLDEA